VAAVLVISIPEALQEHTLAMAAEMEELGAIQTPLAV
jgi:hypothetical protein